MLNKRNKTKNICFFPAIKAASAFILFSAFIFSAQGASAAGFADNIKDSARNITGSISFGARNFSYSAADFFDGSLKRAKLFIRLAAYRFSDFSGDAKDFFAETLPQFIRAVPENAKLRYDDMRFSVLDFSIDCKYSIESFIVRAEELGRANAEFAAKALSGFGAELGNSPAELAYGAARIAETGSAASKFALAPARRILVVFDDISWKAAKRISMAGKKAKAFVSSGSAASIGRPASFSPRPDAPPAIPAKAGIPEYASEIQKSLSALFIEAPQTILKETRELVR